MIVTFPGYLHLYFCVYLLCALFDKCMKQIETRDPCVKKTFVYANLIDISDVVLP